MRETFFEGRVAVCGHGNLGVVEGRHHGKFVGYKLRDPAFPWESVNPTFLNEKESKRVRMQFGDLP